MIRAAVAAGTVVVVLGLGAGGVVGGARDADPPPRATAVPAAAPGVAAAAGPPAALAASVPPLADPVVVARPFDGPTAPWAAGHRGVDLSASVGQVVHAPAAGVVTFAGTVVDRGVVTVTHDDGLRSSLEPVRWAVVPGQRVEPGQVVGTIAAVPGHCAPATCLHWGLRRDEAYVDPMRWLWGRGPVVLLPSRSTLSRARTPRAWCAAAPSPRCASGRSGTR